MLTYLLIYSGAVIFLHISRKKADQGGRFLVFLILSVLVLVIPAAVRDISVGADVRTYQKPLFDLAVVAPSFSRYLYLGQRIVKEYGYLVFVYLITRIFKSIGWVFFFEELLILICVYFAIWNHRKIILPELSLFTYLCIFYLETYNTVRQHISISMLLVAMIWFFKKKYLRAGIMFIIMILFHAAAVICLAIPFIYYLSAILMKSGKRQLIILPFLSALLLVFVLNYQSIFSFVLKKISFLPSRYKYYFVDYSHSFDYPIMEGGICLLIMILILLVLKERNRLDYYGEDKDEEMINAKWICHLVLLNFFLSCGYLIQSTISFAGRLFWYFKVFWLYDIPLGRVLVKDNANNRLLYYATWTILLVFHMYYYNVTNNLTQTIPYKTLWF